MAIDTKNFPGRLYKLTRAFYRQVPSTLEAQDFIDSLINLLFPVRDNMDISPGEMEFRWEVLRRRLVKIITPLCVNRECDCEALADSFFGEVPLIYTGLMQDAEMYHECDPASFCKEEVILCYPGFYAVAVHRFAHRLHRLRVPILPRVLAEYAHGKTGIDIHPGAGIGRRFYIDHGTGVVIGETCEIGDNVKIYQGVTLGATFVDKDMKGTRRHPRLEDNVIVYAGATILGGDTVIGRDTIIGGNVWLTESVPAGSMVFHRADTVVKSLF